MKFDLDYEKDCLYEKWLLDHYSDEIHTKEDLMNRFSDGYMYDEFIAELQKVL